MLQLHHVERVIGGTVEGWNCVWVGDNSRWRLDRVASDRILRFAVRLSYLTAEVASNVDLSSMLTLG